VPEVLLGELTHRVKNRITSASTTPGQADVREHRNEGTPQPVAQTHNGLCWIFP